MSAPARTAEAGPNKVKGKEICPSKDGHISATPPAINLQVKPDGLFWFSAGLFERTFKALH
jgi:hypothetical protein